ncbi:TetR family transcriptional regulator [Paenibacillus yonginensis]|uniref:TetR family transcriptional regulator n=1 Tax=Paenibacillus yonginensis TaxID=1462996 RepID=A0A1B1N004_9BACL|nr:TetR/AcrR family transcriptional regulator [Paenibacillus yonginensis]ANS74754.1 TetR family transcriptional regulator [Paenibacillus yonginensis]
MFNNYNKVEQAVLETTLRLIIEKELQATSMSLIAKESGVSTGNIYHYFSSKEEIINELYRGIVKFNGEFVTRELFTDEPIQTRFERAWRYVAELCQTYSEGFRFIEQYSFSPYITESTKQEAYKVGWCAPLARLYEEAVEQGLFIELDPEMMVQMHYGSMVYLIKGQLQGYFPVEERALRQVIQSFWASVSQTQADTKKAGSGT